MTSINPSNLSYLNRQPYITTTEFRRSPIGASIDVDNLVPNGNYLSQEAALQELIVMASAEADNICLGATGTLCATQNVEQGRYRPTRQGFFVIHPAYWPILEVDSFSIGPVPGNQISIPVSSDTCWIEPRQFTMTGGAFTITTAGPLDFGAVMTQTNIPQFVTYSYVNGFFNQFISASISAGATSLTVPSAVGLYPGSVFTIWDGATTEQVQVAQSYTSGTTIPLVSATTYAHSSGVNVSCLPGTVKQAVIHLVVAAVKQRGDGGLVLNEIGEPTAVTSRTVTSSGDLERARQLLHAFTQVWGRA